MKSFYVEHGPSRLRVLCPALARRVALVDSPGSAGRHELTAGWNDF